MSSVGVEVKDPQCPTPQNREEACCGGSEGGTGWLGEIPTKI